MSTLTQHLETLRAKPYHVRRRIAHSTAGLVTALVALVWLTVSLNAGRFAIHETPFRSPNVEAIVNGVPGTSAALAGVAAAASEQERASIEIIDAKLPGAVTAPEPTVISF